MVGSEGAARFLPLEGIPDSPISLAETPGSGDTATVPAVPSGTSRLGTSFGASSAY